MSMPAISLHQPWASLCVTRKPCDHFPTEHPMVKRFETRSWPCPPNLIGQRIALHATQRKPDARGCQVMEIDEELRAECAHQFRMFLADRYWWPHGEPIRAHILSHLHELAGHDLACWCPLEDADGNRVPCHADVLLELANPGWQP